MHWPEIFRAIFPSWKTSCYYPLEWWKWLWQIDRSEVIFQILPESCLEPMNDLWCLSHPPMSSKPVLTPVTVLSITRYLTMFEAVNILHTMTKEQMSPNSQCYWNCASVLEMVFSFLYNLREMESARQRKWLGPSGYAFLQNDMVLFLVTAPRKGRFNWSKSIN